jgi:hypothetical protein
MKASKLATAVLLAACAFACASPRPTLQPLPTPPEAGPDRVETSCGEYFNPPLFAGRVVGRFPDGSTLPLQGVSFTQAIGEDGLRGGRSKATGITTDGAGLFQATVGISTSDTTWSRSGKVIKSEGWVEDVVFELRSTFCEPLVVHFSMEWTPRDLVLNCRSPRSQVLPNNTLHPSPGVGLGADFVRRLARRG